MAGNSSSDKLLLGGKLDRLKGDGLAGPVVETTRVSFCQRIHHIQQLIHGEIDWEQRPWLDIGLEWLTEVSVGRSGVARDAPRRMSLEFQGHGSSRLIQCRLAQTVRIPPSQ